MGSVADVMDHARGVRHGEGQRPLRHSSEKARTRPWASGRGCIAEQRRSCSWVANLTSTCEGLMRHGDAGGTWIVCFSFVQLSLYLQRVDQSMPRGVCECRGKVES